MSARLQHLLADRANARSFGDDGLERIRLPGGLQHELASERAAEAADPLRVDVRLGAEIVECRDRLPWPQAYARHGGSSTIPTVAAWETDDPDAFELTVDADESALDVFNHPYACADVAA